MAVLLALGVSLFAGLADFLGGFGSRRAPALVVSAVAHGSGIGFSVLLALVVGGDPTMRDLWWGAAAGFGSAIGLVGLYTGYAKSRVGIVAPVAGALATAMPVVLAWTRGDGTSAQSVGGVGLGFAAIVLVSMVGKDGLGSVRAALGYALVGGAGLGFLLIAFSQGSDDGGVWIVAPSRVTGLAVILVMLRLTRPAGDGVRGIVPIALVVAALSSSANGMYAVATHHGSLATVAVVSSMFPAVTVAIAWLVLKERLRPVQILGLVTAVAAVGVMAGS